MVLKNQEVKMTKRNIFLLTLLLILLVLAGCTQLTKKSGLKPAPAFSLKLLDGRTINLQDFRGKGVVLEFWASWCSSCRASAPAFEKAYQKYKDKRVEFLGIAVSDTEAGMKNHINEFGLTYPNGRDATGKIANSYGVTGVPETFFITKEGEIAYKHIGAIDEKTLSALIEEKLLR